MSEPVFLSNHMPAIEAALANLSPGEAAALASEMIAVCEDGKRALTERISAGNTLGLIGDPRIDPLHPAFVAVPRGPFWMGTDPSDCDGVACRYGIPVAWMRKSTPRRQVVLDAFEIARFPVTEGEYAQFLSETRWSEAPGHWVGREPCRFRRNHPVHSISWQSALLYAEWVSEKSGVQVRIPTEAEWEKAARGTDGRNFPWGARFEPRRCNTREGGVGNTTPVGVYPDGASPYGAMDMAGNVEELVADLYWPYPGSDFSDGDAGSYRMTRGGVFCLDSDLARCDRRHGTPHAGPTGFRLCRSAADEWLGRAPGEPAS